MSPRAVRRPDWRHTYSPATLITMRLHQVKKRIPHALEKRPTQRQRGRCTWRWWGRWDALRWRQGPEPDGDLVDRRDRLDHRPGPTADSRPTDRANERTVSPDPNPQGATGQ